MLEKRRFEVQLISYYDESNACCFVDVCEYEELERKEWINLFDLYVFTRLKKDQFTSFHCVIVPVCTEILLNTIFK